MDTYQGTCKYCGNEQPIIAENQETADEDMSNKCECGSASAEQKKAKLMERINYICKGKYNPTLSELTPDQTEMIRQGGLNIMRCNAESITFDTGDSKIKIWVAKEKIKVSRMASQEEVAEI